MTQDQIRRLESLRNRSTCYELAAIRGEERVLIAYCLQHSRDGALRACRNRGQQIIDALKISGTDMLVAGKKASDGFAIGEWQVRFTGRTERDAIISGELPYVGDLVAA